MMASSIFGRRPRGPEREKTTPESEITGDFGGAAGRYRRFMFAGWGSVIGRPAPIAAAIGSSIR